MSFFVTSPELALTREKVAKLNKRAAKAGIPAYVTLVVIATTEKSDRTEGGFVRNYKIHEIEVAGAEAVVLGGYRIAAVIGHGAEGNIIREVPGFPYEVPAEFRTTGAGRCDHCGKVRNRVETVIVYDEAEGFKQVGKQCVQLFLGVSPTALIGWINEVNENAHRDEMGGWGHEGPSTSEFVAAAALATTVYGFVPKSAEGASTASVAGEILRPNQYSRKAFPEVINPAPEMVERANALAEAAIAWIDGVEGDSSSYILNLKVAAKREEVGNNGGLLASLPNAYKRAMATEAERAAKAAARAARDAQAAESGWIGEVGAKVSVKANVVYTNRTEPYSYYSPDGLFAILVTEAGETVYINTTVETAIGKVLEAATRIEILTVAGSVKDHKVNNKGEKVTVLTRCKAV
jgi:hypothetical protein